MDTFAKLPGWNQLTKKEKERLRRIHAPRFKEQYNMTGNLSTTKRELAKEE